MPATLSYPGVYVQEISSGVRPISGVATSIAAFIGTAPQGPTDRAYLVTSWPEYDCLFGGLDRLSYMSYAVYQFFGNGGQQAYIIRMFPFDKDHPDDSQKSAKAATAKVGGIDFGAKGEGKWAEKYKVAVTPNASDNKRFGLQIFYTVPDPNDNGKTIDTLVESYDSLSLSPDDPRYVTSVLKEDSRVTGTTGELPASVTKESKNLANAVDGPALDPVSDAAAFKTRLAADGTGKALLDKIDLFNLLCVPGLSDSGALSDLMSKCEDRRAFLIADLAQSASTETLGKNGPGITGKGQANAAVYFPWIKAPDPRQEGRPRMFPPSGFVAGIYARTDAARGVWKAPAGTDASLTGVYGVDVPLSDTVNGNLNIKAVNCIRNFPVYGTVVWGSRTLKGSNEEGSEWKYVPVRRMALFLEESLYRGLKWVVFEPNDEPLWSSIRLNVGAFMQQLFRQGAFQGSSPREAYFVKCDKDTTTQADINLGIVNIVVGFAPLKPAEFVLVKIQQMAGQSQT